MTSVEAASEALEERPLRELLLQLSRDASRLVEQEIALAKQEAREKLEQVQTGLLTASAGAMLLQVGFLALAAALVLLLAQALPGWAAALSIGAAFCVVGAVVLTRGKQQLAHVGLIPEKTAASLKEDVKVIKEATE
jgi:Putative Actinobacterial Holin-X, holin superfamily III